jgi:hypothetical protein
MQDGVHRSTVRFGLSMAQSIHDAGDPAPITGGGGSESWRERGGAPRPPPTACACAERQPTPERAQPVTLRVTTPPPRNWWTPFRKAGGSPYCFGLGVSLTALAPKCPLCLAAYLSLFGIGGAAASVVHPLLRPLGALLVALAVATLLRHWLGTRRRVSRLGFGAPARPPGVSPR